MSPVKKKQRRRSRESWRQTSRYLRVKTPLQLLVKIREDALRMLLYLANIFILSFWPESVLCDLLCRKNASLHGQGTNLSPSVCVAYIPRRPLRPSATRTLRSWRGIPDWRTEKLPQGSAVPKSVPPKIPGIPHDCLRPPESGWISWIQRILEWQSGFRASL